MGIEHQQPKGRFSFKSPGRSVAMAARWQTSWREAKSQRTASQPVPKKVRDAFSQHNIQLKEHGQSSDIKRKESESKGAPMIKTLPFLLRGGPVDEIVQITGLTTNQVKGVQDRLRRPNRTSLYRLPKPTAQETTAKRRRSMAGRARGSPKIYTESQQRSFDLIRKFWEAGFVTEDLSYWLKLHDVYRHAKRNVPDEFSTALRLEVFLQARLGVMRGNEELQKVYVTFGEEIDSQWFFSESFLVEQRFITAALAANKSTSK